VGPPGPAGPQGPQGVPGSVSGYERVSGSPTALDGNSPKNATADCPSGKVVVGGGYSASGIDDLAVTANGAATNSSWGVVAFETGGNPTWSLQAFAICVTAQ
jgi:hypothetical protein